jgi:hypothetical protein
MKMIQVFSTAVLQTQFIFKDSQNSRCVLQPVNKKSDLGKVSQEFDGSDKIVAKLIAEQFELGTVLLGDKDRKVIEKTIGKDIKEPPVIDAPTKAVNEAVTDALAEADVAHNVVIETLGNEHKDALKEASEKASTDQKDAVDGAVKSTTEKVTKELNKASDNALDELGKEHETALNTLKSDHDQAIKDLEKAHTTALAAAKG